MRIAGKLVAALVAIAWLGTFLPPHLPPAGLAHWPAEWARHLAAGWPAAAPLGRNALGWLVEGAVLAALVPAALSWRALALAAGLVVAVRFTWLAPFAGNAELVGALVALAAWPLAERVPEPWRARVLAAATAAVLYAALAARAPGAAGAHLIPFADVAGHRGLELAHVLATRVFWYGALVCLTAASGLRPAIAGAAVAALLAALALVRLVAGGAVPEGITTDAAIALVTGLALALGGRAAATR